MKRLAIAAVGLTLVVGVIATACSGGDTEAPSGLPDEARDAEQATELIGEYMAHHDWAAVYELVHSDVQSVLTKDQYAERMETIYEGARLDSWNVSDLRVLDSWRNPDSGITYADVAEVRIELTLLAEGQEQSETGALHLVAVDGYYRFFPATASE